MPYRVVLKSVSGALAPILLLLTVLALGAPAPARGQSFPAVTPEEWAITSVPGDPGAGAVVLSKKGEVRLMDLSKQEVSSTMTVTVRMKVLTEAGKEHAEVEVPHSSYFRLLNFSGRTLLPDGRVVPLPKDAKFRRELSENDNVYVTSMAFPAVEVGAVLDYRYEMRFDSILFLEPWYFSERLPVRFSEVVYEVPPTIKARSWSRDPYQVGLKNESTGHRQGTRLRLWAENLPAVPDEPYGLPFGDLATQFLLVPTAYQDADEHFEMMESWQSTVKLFEEWYYGPARRRSGAAKKQAKEIAAGAKAGGPRAVAEALYGFVRDEIETEELLGVELRKDMTPDAVLKARRGDLADKALLLQTMLEAAGVDAHLVWAADRQRGLIDLRLPNPAWFDRIIVAAELAGGQGGERVYLDPSVPLLGFGRLLPGLEGTAALLVDPKKPEEVTLPGSPHDANGRRATLALALDETGAFSGTGEIVLTGHHIWSETPDGAPLAEIEEAWRERLESRFADFELQELTAEGSPDAQEVRVRWSLRQNQEEVLGDEAQLAPSLPLGPASQPFATGAGLRRSPVFFAFGDADLLELTLTWPEGWRLEALPEAVETANGAGVFAASAEADAEGRTLRYRRRFDLVEARANDQRLYEELRALFDAAQRHDGQAVALARR